MGSLEKFMMKKMTADSKSKGKNWIHMRPHGQ